jgi:hypothetical protein
VYTVSLRIGLAVASGARFLAYSQGFLCIPFNFPGFTFRKAVKSRERMVVLLNEMVGEARKYMKLHPGQVDYHFIPSLSPSLSCSCMQPRCLLDVAVEVDEKYPEPTPDLDLAYHVLDFLFASQVRCPFFFFFFFWFYYLNAPP